MNPITVTEHTSSRMTSILMNCHKLQIPVVEGGDPYAFLFLSILVIIVSK
jgi:hypothetical protein